MRVIYRIYHQPIPHKQLLMMEIVGRNSTGSFAKVVDCDIDGMNPAVCFTET